MGIAEHEATSNDKNEELSKLREKHKEMILDMNTTNGRLEAKILSLKRDNEQLESDKDKKIESINGSVKALQKENECWKAKFSDLKQRFDSHLIAAKLVNQDISTQMKSVHFQKQVIADLQAENSRLNKETIQMQEIMKSERVTVQTMKNEREKIAKKLSVHKRLYSELERNKNNEIALLKSNLEEQRITNAQLQRKGMKLRDRLEKDVVAVTSLTDDVHIKSEELDVPKQLISELAREKKTLQKKLQKTASKNEQLLSQIENLQDSHLHSNNELKHALTSCKAKAQKYKLYHELYQDLKEKLENKEKLVEYITNEVGDLKKMWNQEKQTLKKKHENELQCKTKAISEVEKALEVERANRESWETQCRRFYLKAIL